MRKRIPPEVKARAALHALRGEKTISQIASEYSVHPNQIGQWKSTVVAHAVDLFSKSGNAAVVRQQELADKLHRTIGELKVENDWLKKKLDHLG